ncbi:MULTISPECIES: SDR family NAD(P)-dependent oxidoreductase [unclassified Streptomyces]|uniref:SDR family oxidoreductase n=1 Tax=unclassified Streptomyces TaxID=2593676 RepID=UPI00288B6A77|nr:MULTISPECIES: SDR family NAD(P)-dependent oxidoreductase [unclassified Streptomyces]WNI21427.1 SDR family NAD(P)-dependent oxidoreductase [Streptomyces sp. ITFR-16]WNI28246.1 SDR family NAD(P)-dependent oxidoreductase [Streptomyces sp. ITFR-6]
MPDQKVALITGAASGIGLAVATLLAEESTVVLLDRSEAVWAVAERIEAEGHRVLPLVADLGNHQQIDTAVGRMHELVGPCDILVNNAGIHPKRNGIVPGFEDLSLEEWDRVMRINLSAPFLLCQRAVAPMREKGWGRIINVASRAGRTYSDRAGTHYSASKAGLIGMTRKIAGDYARYGITANCVAPGQIETPLARTSDPQVLQNAAMTTPARRLGTAAEVASAIRYLASDQAGFVNGAVVDVNGGGFIGS